MRGDVRKVIPATMSPRASHTTGRCQIVATNVGSPVWPAEYRIASPYSARATTDTARPLSSWRARDSTVDRYDGRNRVGQHGNLERLWRRVRRDGHAQPGGSGFLEAEVVCDRAADDRDRRGAVLGELDDGPDDDLRLLGRREPDEPAMGGPVGVLRRPGLSGDLQSREAPAAGCPLLDDGNHGAAQDRELIGVQIEGCARSGRRRRPHDKWGPRSTVTRELLVQAHHLDERLGVLALSDRQVQRHRRGP